MATEGVAIVVTACDYGRFLRECLESLDRQSQPPAEVLIVDDASTDDTSHVLAQTIPTLAIADRLSIRRNAQRQGLAASLNLGIRLTRSKLVAHIDADDTIEPGYVERLSVALEAHPEAGYAYPRLRLFGAETGLMASYRFDPGRLVFEGNYIPNVALMRRRAFEESGGFRPGRTHIDWDLWLSFLESGWPGVLVDEPLYNWRRHGGAMTYQPVYRLAEARLRVMSRHGRLMWQHRSEAARWTASAVRRRLPGAGPSDARLTPSGWVTAHAPDPDFESPARIVPSTPQDPPPQQSAK